MTRYRVVPTQSHLLLYKPLNSITADKRGCFPSSHLANPWARVHPMMPNILENLPQIHDLLAGNGHFAGAAGSLLAVRAWNHGRLRARAAQTPRLGRERVAGVVVCCSSWLPDATGKNHLVHKR